MHPFHLWVNIALYLWTEEGEDGREEGMHLGGLSLMPPVGKLSIFAFQMTDEADDFTNFINEHKRNRINSFLFKRVFCWLLTFDINNSDLITLKNWRNNLKLLIFERELRLETLTGLADHFNLSAVDRQQVRWPPKTRWSTAQTLAIS